MRVVLVGSGNVATSLGLALCKAGHEIVQVCSAHLSHAQELAQRLASSAFTDNLVDLEQADAYVLSVADASLQGVATAVSETLAQNGRNSNAVVIHTAGSLPIDVIPYPHRAVLYPMQTFSKAAPADFAHLPLFLEAADSEADRVVSLLAHSLSDQVFRLSTDERKYLHLAAVFCCNFANHCMAIGAEVLKAHGLPFAVMMPLVEGMTQKLYRLSPREAQTGPAARRDANVMESQLGLLQEDGDADLAKIYEILSSHIQTYLHD